MERRRWERLQVVFDEAIELPIDERPAYLTAACSDDPDLRLQVESLLSATDRTRTFVGGMIRDAARDAFSEVRAGQRIGAYEIVREVDRGGMGAVFLARRADDEYDAEVAIKLIRGVYTAEHLRRFLAERQILAGLDHPNIARMLDGGTTPDGVPYVVMEYVDGVPIDVYCDRQGLSVDERLRLFLKVCDAVRDAHRNLVVHRDLKPSNVLVTADGEPKLLDFGIAKLLEPAESDAEQTRTALRPMTPAYASPEQLRGDPVTVATDVYGLGLVLYRLLVGRAPYDVSGRTPGEVERIVGEREPTRPSTAVATAAETVAGHAVSHRRLQRRLRGDLDTIVLTALRKDPARRYASVERFAEDLARHLDGHPVRARGDTWRYRAGKFIRRHRSGVAAAATIVLLVVGFAAAMAVQAERIARQRDAAERARASAERVSSFLIDLFEVADPGESRGGQITAREILDRGAAQIAGDLGEAPATRATMMDVMGRVYENLGLYDRAAPLLDSALALRRAAFGEDHADVAASLTSTAGLLATLGEWDSARVMYGRALEMRRRMLPSDDPDLATTLAGLAGLESEAGDYDAAEPLFREALAILQSVHGGDAPDVAAVMVDLGGVLRRMGDYAAAEPLLRDGLAMRRRLLGDDHLEVGHALNQLARLLVLQGRPAAALPYAREGLAVRRRNLGDMHVEVGASLGNVAGILNDLGDDVGAVAARRESLEIMRHNFGDAHPYTAATLQSLAYAHHVAGQLDSARVNYERAVELQQSVLAPDDPNLGFALTGLGRVLVDLGRAAEAEPHLRKARAVRRGGLPAGHWFIAASESALGECLTRLGRYEEAEPLLTRSLETLRGEFGEDNERTAEVRAQLVDLYTAWGRPDRAAAFRNAASG